MGKPADFLLNLKYALRIRKPRLILRLANAVVKSYVLRRPPLRYVDFAVDFACNLKCRHCFAAALKQEQGDKMALTDYRQVVDDAMRLGAVNFSIQGGEPLVYGDLKETIAACRPRDNVISVTTNGTLIDKATVANLKRWGVDILTVSLDSAHADEHDHFRGVSGTFEKTLTGIKLALKSGLRVTLGAVVTHQTLRTPGMLALMQMAKNMKVLLYFIFPVPAGRWADNQSIFLTSEDLAYIDTLTRGSSYLRTDFQANWGALGCGAVKEILYLTPYGDVLPCPFVHISLGNVKKESLDNIRSRALVNPYFGQYHPDCLASTDRFFIQRYLSQTFSATQLPLSYHHVFSDMYNPSTTRVDQ